MAASSEEADTSHIRSPVGTPGKVRDLISEGIVSRDQTSGRKEVGAPTEENNGSVDTVSGKACEATTKDSFFSRVESFSSLKWAGMPPELSPLICAKYGWSNIECDMLKCSSCNAYLCASLQPTLDISKYKQRCLELQNSLRNAHEKFCFWPDSSCPEHYWALLFREPTSVLSDFIQRFQGLCHLEMQLPSLKYEELKSMELTEETVSLLLHMIEDELKPKDGENLNGSMGSDSLLVHVSACILALCGWQSSPSPGSPPLSIISCSRCMRKVGLWGFQQLEAVDLDTSLGPPSTPASPGDGHFDRIPLSIVSPNRRVTRSRDTEQSPASAFTRTRNWEASSPADSDTVRSRPVTRSMGQGETTLSTELSSSPHRRTKRPRLYSSSSSDTSPRCCLDPLTQHRSWCPWVNPCQTEKKGAEDQGDLARAAESGWKSVLRVLLAENKSRTLSDSDSSSVPEKSRKVFKIFRQWKVTASS
ncbi:zinc finger C3HC-type protein 1 [Bombina bombina]|uniref:zinc finger C3HC-type protein 1 n=1 Tax=Bombina bombina TaxID=8345 RepID=UPI00235ACF36|nr:zinc finger C3HC-type protein 1 [Bombina bombina]